MAIGFSLRFGFLLADRRVERPAEVSTVVNPSIRVKVYPRWLHYVALEWSVPSDWGDCAFNVYHSATEEGNYVKVNPSPINGNSLVDYSNQDYHKFRNGYYVVEAILVGQGGASLRSQPHTWHNTRSPWVELRAQEVQRREFLLLRKFTGVKSYLMKRRTYGLRCPNCWDSVSETVTKDYCKVCFGTSFKGGYFPPIPLFVQYEPTPSSVMKTYFGKFEPNQIGAWTVSVPEIAPDDILIRTGDWNIYEVGSLQTTELQSSPVRQIMQIKQLGRRDVENDLILRQLAEFPTEFENNVSKP